MGTEQFELFLFVYEPPDVRQGQVHSRYGRTYYVNRENDSFASRSIPHVHGNPFISAPQTCPISIHTAIPGMEHGEFDVGN
jgi:hypothetical protein